MQTVAKEQEVDATQLVEAGSDQQLGSVVLRCRSRRRIGAWLEAGAPPIPILLAPFVVALILTLIPVYVSQTYFHLPAPAKDPVIGACAAIWFVAWVGVVFYYFFSAPESAFHLHENGFRYKGRTVRFSELSAIRFGLPQSGFQGAMLGVTSTIAPASRHARSALRMNEATQDGSLTLEFNDQSTWPIRGILAAYQMADLESVFEYIGLNYPDLVN